jgi:hypothetical protein
MGGETSRTASLGTHQVQVRIIVRQPFIKTFQHTATVVPVSAAVAFFYVINSGSLPDCKFLTTICLKKLLM